ncbi:cobalt uptake protein COT1 [Sodiomyces alkalinus F11]|uniref:Cobalt uptake protein COT1 n=1 Tax=Sodiomyces alkalinus (strain CBS 110278 / VKM F-3762 / F11) TaxID=1314773 RepID=A0A3N2PKP9_SODAK|nr:cobalt uptake protein COT1 [Sodiomyces alkalinus F11]ROT34990.1 cobalt uptake protein COT1 [Sodiomyces alkalinus F11]
MAWSKSTRISVMLVLDIVFFLLELIVGMLVKSLALLADAFHMLNDIISLCVGLWAVAVASKATTDKFSYGWLRAEILGAFFNAVFLIALCISIILEAITRFFDPPDIDNPKLILIVGSVGLASNLVGFIILGGHGHDHGHDDHDHGHDHEEHGQEEHDHPHSHDHAAEEGRATSVHRHAAGYEDGGSPVTTVGGPATLEPSTPPRRIRFSTEDTPNSRGSASSRARDRSRRRAASLRQSRLPSIDDMNFYPSSFRQDIIDASRSRTADAEEADEDVDVSGSQNMRDSEPAEDTPLLKPDGEDARYHLPAMGRPRRDSSVHGEHNHRKPREGKKSLGHSHGDMGLNGLILHVLGDALGNVGVIATALIIWLTDWPGKMYADPAVSLFITLIILKSAVPLTVATSKILLQATPDHIDLNEIREDIQNLPGVMSCHHVHVWQLSDTRVVASMHVQVSFPITAEGGEKYMELAKRARQCLHAYGIHSATIQPEFRLDDEQHACVVDEAPAPGDDPAAWDAARNNSLCLLECVDECVGKGCCSTGTTIAGSSPPSQPSHGPDSPTHSH